MLPNSAVNIGTSSGWSVGDRQRPMSVLPYDLRERRAQQLNEASGSGLQTQPIRWLANGGVSGRQTSTYVSPLEDPECLFRTSTGRKAKPVASTRLSDDTFAEETVIHNGSRLSNDEIISGNIRGRNLSSSRPADILSNVSQTAMAGRLPPVSVNTHDEEIRIIEDACQRTKGLLRNQPELDADESVKVIHVELSKVSEDMQRASEVSHDLQSQLKAMKQRDVIHSKQLLEAIEQVNELRTMVRQVAADRDSLKAEYFKLLDQNKNNYALNGRMHEELESMRVSVRRAHEDLAHLNRNNHGMAEELIELRSRMRDGQGPVIKQEGGFRERQMPVRAPLLDRIGVVTSPVVPKPIDSNQMILELFKLVTNNNNNSNGGSNKRTLDATLITPTKFDGAESQLIEDFLSDVDRYIRVNDFEDEMSVEVLKKYLSGKALTNFMEQKRIHPDRTYREWKKVLVQRYHVEGTRKLAAVELRQLSYNLGEDFDAYFERAMNLCDKLQADMPPEVRVEQLIAGIKSPEICEKLFNMEISRPEHLRTNVHRILGNMKELNRMKQAAGVRFNFDNGQQKEVVNVDSDVEAIYDERLWLTNRGDPLCARCGTPGHFRRQCDSKAMLDRTYVKQPGWLLALAENTRVPRAAPPPGGNRPHFARAEQESEN